MQTKKSKRDKKKKKDISEELSDADLDELEKRKKALEAKLQRETELRGEGGFVVSYLMLRNCTFFQCFIVFKCRTVEFWIFFQAM